MSSIHGGLLKYPIFRDISEIKRMRKQCVPGVLSPLPSERLGTRLTLGRIGEIHYDLGVNYYSRVTVYIL